MLFSKPKSDHVTFLTSNLLMASIALRIKNKILNMTYKTQQYSSTYRSEQVKEHQVYSMDFMWYYASDGVIRAIRKTLT